MMIDTHFHVTDKDDMEKIIAKMNGNYMIASGAAMEDIKKTLEYANKYSNIYGTIGFHPDEAENVTDEDLLFIEKNLGNKIVGIGEIGLDYYHDTDKELQKNLFIKQLELAKKYNMPVVVHSRDAAEDTFEILSRYKELKKVLHCYSYSKEMADKFLKIGCYFGIGGVLTFKNGKKLVEVVENVDLSKLLLETDSPYLSPEPHRGEVNEPFNITYVAEKIAEIKGISVEEVYEKTFKNACEIYNIKI